MCLEVLSEWNRANTYGEGECRSVKDVNHSETCPDTPQHNLFSERMNRTLTDPTRVTLKQAGLSAKYWKFGV